MSEMKMFNKRLKPCPFCNGAPELIESAASTVRFNEGAVNFSVSCSGFNCEVKPKSSLWQITPEEAVEAWNKRPYDLDWRELHKFKLINREGYIKADSFNEEILKKHFIGDTIEGYLDEWGDLMVEQQEVVNHREFKFFEEVFDTVTDSDNQKGETVMEEQELRKFKLIDREGYINTWFYNKTKLRDYFVEDIVEGYINEDGTLEVEEYPVISPSEFKFFEEVLA